MKKEYLIGALIIAILISFIAFTKVTEDTTPGKYDDFAKCLTDKGAVLYGTDLCSQCKNQEKMFGKSFRNINFIDCKDNIDACLAAGIRIYPTWTFNSQTYEGIKYLGTLAEITGCEIDNTS